MTISLSITSQAAQVRDQAERAWVVREILRRLVIVADRPELTKKKANVAEDNIYRGSLDSHKSFSQDVLRKMQAQGYVFLKSTGSRTREDPTKKFRRPRGSLVYSESSLKGIGPMTQEILEAVRT